MPSPRLNILHCLSTREFAGTERHVAELTAAQSTRHNVTLLLENQTRDPLTGGDIINLLPPGPRIVRAGKEGYLLRLAQLQRREDFHIVHTHLGRASARATWLRKAGLWGTTPLVATLHTDYRPRCYGSHDGLVCIASWQQEKLPESRRKRSILISNWTLPPKRTPAQESELRAQLRREWGLDPDCFVIGAVGRMVQEKNFCVLIKAWRKANLPTNTALVLIGDGPERQRLERECCDAGRVVFTGFRTDMPDALAGLDAFVMPSRKEPFGLVLLEAMCAKLPVCATAAGGVLDILRNAPECLVPPQDEDALSVALSRLYSSPRREWDMSGYCLQQQSRRLETFYRHLCSATDRSAETFATERKI